MILKEKRRAGEEMFSIMMNEVKITLDEFREYMNLKTQDRLLDEQLNKMEFMSGLSVLELSQMDLKSFSIDDSDPQIDKLTFTFNLPKKELRKKWGFDVGDD